MNEENEQEDIVDLMAAAEKLYSDIWDYASEQEIPLSLNVHPQVQERLAESMAYEVIRRAISIEKEQIERIGADNTEADALKQIYPMLGNAIQVVYEYFNAFIDFGEMVDFYEKMGNECESAMDAFDPIKYEPFFTPSSFYKRNKTEIAHHVLKDRATIDRHYKLIKRLEAKYKQS